MEIVAFQFDLGRQKENIPFLKKTAEFVKNSGYNTVILYLENCVRTSETPFFKKEETYSLQEMKEIVDYMEGLGLDVVPAFENLGHLEKFLDYKQLGKFAETQDCSKEGRGWWYPRYKRGQNGCVSNTELQAFMDRYITEVCSVFHSKYIHMGLDEVFDFAICKKCKERIKNGKTKQDMFYKHIVHCNDLVKSLGRQMMMWDDFFEYFDVVERLPRDIIMCTWEYSFVGDELAGKWTNRKRRDPFRTYDKLGFKYLFCTYAHNAGSTYNIDTLTAYANKFSPIGAINTTWERASTFYQGMYPSIAYTGALWNGKIQTQDDAVKIYQDLLGGKKEIAELLLSLEIPTFLSGCTDSHKMAECDYFVKRSMRKNLAYALQIIRPYLNKVKGETKDILTDIYDFIYDNYLGLETSYLGTLAFDGYESGKQNPETLSKKAEEIASGYEEIKANSDKLWKKYRKGIQSCNNAYENDWNGKIEKAKFLAKEFATKKDVGVLYFDAMMHDAYSTVKAEIRVKYQGDTEETVIHKGAIKPSVARFDVGASYGFRFATENKPVEYAVLDVYGEGALWPLNMRHLALGDKVMPKAVEKLYGNVKDEQNLLLSDTQFATMGYNDGLEHLINEKLWRKRSGVKFIF